MRAIAAALACLLPVAGCGGKSARHVRSGPMDPPAYWVWHRGSPLTDLEKSSLQGNRLYWQAAECAWSKAGWGRVRISPPLRDPAVTPVFRLRPETAFLGAPGAAKALAVEIRRWADGWTMQEIQLDFDCPDRLLGNYASFLESLGREMKPCRISITALAAWPRHPEFGRLADAVSSLCPMFYDLEPDAPDGVRARRFHPMADTEVARLIALWSRCPKPWLAGLPNFERLSVFDGGGRLIGHLRGWRHDEVFFHPDLKARAAGPGIKIFESPEALDLSGTMLPAGGVAVHRMPDEDSLAILAEAAKRAGAVGLIHFALPGPGLQAAYSPSHLASNGRPRARLTISKGGVITLENPGPRDLPAGMWELEIRSGRSGAFRSASPGGFAMVEGSGGLPADLGTVLMLRFSKLPAGAAVSSGPLVGDAEGLRWSLRGVIEDQPVDAADSTR